MIDWTRPEPPTSSLVASICRCTSPQMHAERASENDRLRHDFNIAEQQKKTAAAEAQLRAREAELAKRTPRADQFQILDVAEVGASLVLKVKYPSCSDCSYEGLKVLVFDRILIRDVVFWTRIDPHFSHASKPRAKTEAPSPAARFPASPEGWQRALAFAKVIG